MYLILLAGLLLAYVLQSYLTKRLWKRGLSVTLRFRDHYIYEGDTSVLREIVANDKRFPLPALEVRFAMSAGLAFRGESADNTSVTDQTYKRDVFSLLMHQQITRSLEFTGKKRGCYRIAQADVKAYDFFYRQCGYEMQKEDTILYVYPSQVDTRKIQTICTAISGSVLVQSHLFPDPFEFAGIREYTPSDPMNRINWKASMRLSAPMVNQFDSTTNLDLAVVFDLDDSGILKQDYLVEETIRIVSSLAARLVKNRMTVSLYANAAIPEETGLFFMNLSAGTSCMAKLNERLACICGAAMSSQELLSNIVLSSEQLMIFISKNANQAVIDALAQTATAAHPVLWVIPKMRDSELSVPDIPSVRTLVWEVSV